MPLAENKFETNVEPVSTIEEIKDTACLDNELPKWGPKSLKIILQKMCLGLMSFRVTPAAPKQTNYHNSPNMQPIITLLQVLVKFMKRHLLTIVLK